MTLDAASLKKLTAAVTENLDNMLAPLREEIASLREALDALEERSVAPSSRKERSTSPRRPSSRETAPEQPCQVPGCPAPVLAKELCETHYRIMRRSLAADEEFDASTQRPARVRKGARSCEIDACEEAHYAKGLCRRHYMAERSRIRNAQRQGAPAARVERRTKRAAARAVPPTAVAPAPEPQQETPEDERPQATGASQEDAAEIVRQESLRRELGGTRNPFETSEPMSTAPDGSLPTAEMVSRVVAQYRGGLDRVAEVLGRNKRTLIDLLDHLDLMPYVARVRGAERQRVENSSLRDRLNDLLFREKLLEDLGCLKEVDERTGFEVKMRCADLAKKHETIEDVLTALSSEFRLEESGMKRLIWRYDLRRYLRGQGLKSTTQARVRV